MTGSLVNDKLVRMWNETAALSWNLTGQTEENHEEFQLGWSVTWRRYKPGSFLEQFKVLLPEPTCLIYITTS
jgi:hypothetical protein